MVIGREEGGSCVSKRLADLLFLGAILLVLAAEIQA